MEKKSWCNLLFSVSLLLVLSFPAFSQQQPIGVFTGNSDVGKVLKPGTANYNPDNRQYEITASGYVWADKDDFHYVWKQMQGDFILYTRASLQGESAAPYRKLGWMVRADLETNSPYVSTVVHGNGLTGFQYRATKGDSTREVRSNVTGADVIELERKGNTFTMRVAKFGEPFSTEEITHANLGDAVYVGLFLSSHNREVQEKGVFRDVRITVPASDKLVPYREYIGSNLEILDVTTGDREIIYTSPRSLQAPNWTPDGKTLIYNADGLMYTFDLATRQPKELYTGKVRNNNNDHVLSFDGKMLGLSSGVPELGGSIIYTVPVTGGEPKQITPRGPSYLHGWSPDGKFLVFTGERNKEFDIYKIPAKGGKEIRLTKAKGLDDGSEYTPDGKYIYFNSNRTGNMQIWRMKPDGSEQVAVTNDDFHDWFPHVSPDGKWILFLSFLKEEVESGDHPFYKHIYLRLMPITGGEPKVVAYFYGGQGSINTPSWSPDSKKVAFISNTDVGTSEAK